MAGPSVAVRVLGDLSGMNKAFSDATSKASTAGSSISSGLKTALGGLNQTGILGGLEGGLAGKLAGGGGAVATLGVGLSALGSKDQAAHQQLQQSIENTGQSYEDFGGQVEEAIKHQESFGHTANQTQDALRILTQATGDPAKALEYLNTVSDLAAAKHEDLGTAATQLGKAYNGSTKILKEFGVETGPKAEKASKDLEAATKGAASADDAAQKAHQKLSDVQALLQGKTKLTTAEQIRLRDATQNAADADAKAQTAHDKLTAAQDEATKSASTQGDTMQALADKLNGQASAASDTFGGKMKEMRAKIEDAASSLGQKYGPAITAAGTAMTGLGASLKIAQGVMGAFKTTQEGVAVAEGVATAAAGAEATAMDVEAASATAADAASLPILVTVGLIVLAIVALIAIAWVLSNNWDTIWKGMKTAASDTWDAIKAAASAVWDWIKGVWQDVYNDLIKPIERAVKWIEGVPNKIVGFFENIVHDLGNVFGKIGDAITGAFKGAFNAVAKVWNDTLGKFSFTVPDWVPVIGSRSFSMPQMPTLAEGGLITATGVVFAHAGEVIAPVEKVLGRGGPVMHIENATFNEPVDVDLLSKQLEFALSAGLPV
jgi:hypothetical protein